MPSDLREAQRMRDLFCSVGAGSFVVTKTELEWPGHKKAKWGRTYSVPELRQKLPAMVRTATQFCWSLTPVSTRFMAAAKSG